MINGPAWIRIDELQNGETYHNVINVNYGWNRIILQPGKDRPNALFRVFKRVVSSDESSPVWRVKAPVVDAVRPPLATLSKTSFQQTDRLNQDSDLWA